MAGPNNASLITQKELLCAMAHISWPKARNLQCYIPTRFRRNCVQRVAWFVSRKMTRHVMLLMNEAAIDKLLSSKYTIGGDASVAAGPVGRTSSAATDAQLHAELLTIRVHEDYSPVCRSRVRPCRPTMTQIKHVWQEDVEQRCRAGKCERAAGR